MNIRKNNQYSLNIHCIYEHSLYIRIINKHLLNIHDSEKCIISIFNFIKNAFHNPNSSRESILFSPNNAYQKGVITLFRCIFDGKPNRIVTFMREYVLRRWWICQNFFSPPHTPRYFIYPVRSRQLSEIGRGKIFEYCDWCCYATINLRLIRVLFVEYLVDFYWWCFGVMTRWKRERMVS